MIFRATGKVLNINRLKPDRNDAPLHDQLPGEWYVDLISLGNPGKFALHYLHHPTKIVIIVRGRSLKKSNEEFKDRLQKFLVRNGYSELIGRFELDSNVEIFPTNDRGMIATMNQIKWNSESHCTTTAKIDLIDYDWIEDISINYLFRMKKTGKRYWHTKQILDQYLQENNESEARS